MNEKHVALLFSIGVGAGRRLIMADWRAMMQEMGLRNPRTLIATGNAMFERDGVKAGELEVRLEDAFERRFGRRVDVLVRGATAFQRLIEGNPFPKESKRDGSKVVVRVMRQPLEKNVEEVLKPYLTQGERVRIVRGDLWVCFRDEPNQSRLMPVLGSKRLGIGTVRNWNTMRRLGEMVAVNPI